MENEVAKKRTKMDNMGLHLQPFIIVVGPSAEALESVHIRIDDITYMIPSLLTALDVLFKIYITVNIAYPLESENICYFIQRGIFNIQTVFDDPSPFVSDTIDKIIQRV